ncbi:hypothetical protein COCOBI_pt-2330 (chloroplast) [Coccomyxa sp. Obi]|nr:hypothetical protein COCOBI_pt-2330 [Coccomyxa sp. Obi]
MGSLGWGRGVGFDGMGGKAPHNPCIPCTPKGVHGMQEGGGSLPHAPTPTHVKQLPPCRSGRMYSFNYRFKEPTICSA